MLFGKKIVKTIKVDGMHCAHCAGKVENALKAIDGVKSVKVDLDNKEVAITSSVEIDDVRIEEAVAAAGFTVIK